jgi:hypothetical protein
MPRPNNPSRTTENNAPARQTAARGSTAIPSTDSLGWQAAWMQSARAALQVRRIVSAEERDAPALTAVDSGDQDTLAGNIVAHEPVIPAAIAKELAYLALASGSPENYDWSSMSVIDVPSYKVLAIPLTLRTRPAFVPPDADSSTIDPTNLWRYCWAHGTTLTAAATIIKEDVLRPAMWSGEVEGPRAQYPTLAFFGTATPGDPSIGVLHTLSARLLAKSKGRQGILIGGSFASAVQHQRLDSGNTDEEQRMTRQVGIVRGPDRWAIHCEFATPRFLMYGTPV